MSRNIPQVRTWRVTYWAIESKPIVCGIKRRKLGFCEVQTINKMFAKWLARDALGWQLLAQANKVTVSLVRR